MDNLFKNITYYKIAAGKDHHLVAAELKIRTDDKLVENSKLEKNPKEQENLLKEELHSMIYEQPLLQNVTECEYLLGQLYTMLKASDLKDNEVALDIYQNLANAIQDLFVKIRGKY